MIHDWNKIRRCYYLKEKTYIIIEKKLLIELIV
jgi:hypothetical protein